MHQTSKLRLRSLIAACALAGCVSQGQYDAALRDVAIERGKRQTSEQMGLRERQAFRADIARLYQELAEAKVALAAAEQEVEFAGGIAIACGEALDESTSTNAELAEQLAKLGKDVDQLAASKVELTGSLERARAGLEELRKAQADAESRAALFRDVAQRLRRMLDAGELKIRLRSGRMVLVLPSDILFDSGKAKIAQNGRRVLGEVGGVLATLSGRRFQVSGHTDTDPIRVSGFASNWDLSSARALEVVSVLIESGMKPMTLSAAGYAEFDPIAANDSTQNKARNRRIEIVLQPNIDEVIELPLAAPAAQSAL
jgi:chemotaxis protein MotB